MADPLTSSPARSRRAALEERLVVGLVLLPPLFVWIWGFEGYAFPKKILVSLLATGLGAVVVWRALRGESFRLELHPILGCAAVWWIWNAVSLLWSRSPSLTLERVVWLGIVGAAMIFVQSHAIGRRGAVVGLGRWLILTAGLLSLWAVVMDFLGLAGESALPIVARLGDWRDRISVAGLGNTGHIADFLVLAFPAALMVYLHTWDARLRLACLGTLGLVAAALVVCWSVHSNASLVIVMLCGLILLLRLHRARWWRRRGKRIAALFAVWVCVVLFFVLPHPLNPHPGGILREAFGSPRWAAGWPTRVAIWETTLEMIRRNVVVGIGAGNFTYVYPSVDSLLVRTDPGLAVYANRWTNAAHNEILQAWAETGIVGLVVAVMMVGSAILTYARRMRVESPGNRMILWCGMLSLGAWVLQAQMNFPLQMPVATLWLGFLLSVPVVLSPRQTGTPSAILFPVQLEKFGIRLTVYLRNMQVPCRLAIEGVWSPTARGIAGVALLGLVAAACLIGWRGLSAERELREGKQVAARFLQPQWGYSPAVAKAALEAAEPHYQRALRLWPWMTDARSAWTDLLVRAEEWNEALKQNALVRPRLDAIEVHFREAWSRFNLGQRDEARAAFQVVRDHSINRDGNGDGIPDNLPLDLYWAKVYVRLRQAFP